MSRRTIFFDGILPAVLIVALLIGSAWAAFVSTSESEINHRQPVEYPGRRMGPPETEAVGRLEQMKGKASDYPGYWPCFRGEGYEGKHQGLTLFTDYQANSPVVKWEIELGEGHAGPAVWKGRVYLLDYDREKEEDVLRCLSLESGNDIWQYRYKIKVKRNHGMSRTVPAVTEDVVVSLGPKCHVHALNPVDGSFYWSKDLIAEYGTEVPQWYAGQCPIIEDGVLYLAPAGPEVLMLALDAKTGEEIWRSPNLKKWKMTHSSILPVQIGERRVLVYPASGGVAGVDADTGEILFLNEGWSIQIATVPTPVDAGNGRVFLSGGYSAGSMMIRVFLEEGKVKQEILWRLPAEKFGSHQHTPIYHDGILYGVDEGGLLTGIDPENGNILWKSDAGLRFGIGPYLLWNDKMFVMNDEGHLYLFRVSGSGCELLTEQSILPGPDSWGPMAPAGDLLLLRDLTLMKCLKVAREE